MILAWASPFSNKNKYLVRHFKCLLYHLIIIVLTLGLLYCFLMLCIFLSLEAGIDDTIPIFKLWKYFCSRSPILNYYSLLMILGVWLHAHAIRCLKQSWGVWKTAHLVQCDTKATLIGVQTKQRHNMCPKADVSVYIVFWVCTDDRETIYVCTSLELTMIKERCIKSMVYMYIPGWGGKIFYHSLVPGCASCEHTHICHPSLFLIYILRR